MPLASKGLGTGLSVLNSARQAPSHNLASGVRSLHIPLPRSGPVSAPSGGTSFASSSTKSARSSSATIQSLAGRILQSTRNSLAGFVRHLTTPGLSHPVGRPLLNANLSAHAAVRGPTIHQRLSVPARHALSTATKRPFTTQSTFQVGLGLTRNFSSARPFFQNVVQNVPVAGRALYNVDLDVQRKAKMNTEMRNSKRSSKVAGKENKNLKHFEKLSQTVKEKQVVTEEQEEHSRYFAPPAFATGMSTVLLIPLAPTPSARVPLSDATTEPLLLPFPELSSIITSHHLHSLRISTLFSRLDAGGVWDKGVQCSAHGDASGLCTVLRIEFNGWTETMVRRVIGEAGKGWCRIIERNEDVHGLNTAEELQSDTGLSSISTSSVEDLDCFGLREPSDHRYEVDPAHSFVLPTLDFSSSFVTNARQPETSAHSSFYSESSDADFDGIISSGMSSAFASTDSLSDMAVDLGFGLATSGPRPQRDVEWSPISYPTRLRSNGSDVSTDGWIAFSSDFMSRSQFEPQEALFY